jgi:hypothetical protein
MKHALFALALGLAPASADTLPFKPGDHVVETHLMAPETGDVTPNPLPAAEQACFRVEEISPTNLWLRLEAGYLDMRMPMFGNPGAKAAKPVWAPVGTGSGHQSSDPIFEPCLPPDPTGYDTVNTMCEMARLYTLVPDCSGRPIPQDLP